MRKKWILIAAIILIAIAVIVGINLRDETVDVNIKEEQMVEPSKEDATLEFITNEIDNIGIIGVNGEKLIVSTKSIGSDIEKRDTQGITRYQLIDTMYTMLKETNTVPNIKGYQIADYEDASSIPDKYLQGVCYITYLELVEYKPELNGYKYATKKEVSNAFKKCKDYIESYEPGEYDISNWDGDTASEVEKTKNKAIEILANRTTEDKLNGGSIAIFKNPKTLGEVQSNIDRLKGTSVEREVYTDKFEKGEAIERKYINIEEGLIDTNKIANIAEFSSIDNITNKILGIAYMGEYRYNIDVGEDTGTVVVSGEVISRLNKVTKFGIVGAFAIKNNSIVSVGVVPTYEDGSAVLVFDGIADIKNIDSIGFIVEKLAYENKLIFDEEHSYMFNSQYIVLMSDLDIQTRLILSKVGDDIEQ